ncbi:MAG: hypothetical protein JXR58_02110 [Bacteroidales bacterium]|nr:hypothetical protein [Bacteroidales bacterium]
MNKIIKLTLTGVILITFQNCNSFLFRKPQLPKENEKKVETTVLQTSNRDSIPTIEVYIDTIVTETKSTKKYFPYQDINSPKELLKLLPDVSYQISRFKDDESHDIESLLVFYYKDKYYRLFDFNGFIIEYEKENKLTINNKIKAFVILTFWSIDVSNGFGFEPDPYKNSTNTESIDNLIIKDIETLKDGFDGKPIDYLIDVLFKGTFYQAGIIHIKDDREIKGEQFSNCYIYKATSLIKTAIVQLKYNFRKF